MSNHKCKRLEFSDKCPYIYDTNGQFYFEYYGQIINRAPIYECKSVPCHYAIEKLLKQLVKSVE